MLLAKSDLIHRWCSVQNKPEPCFGPHCFILRFFYRLCNCVQTTNKASPSFTRSFCGVSYCLALLWSCAPFIPLLCLWWNLNEKAEGHCVVFHHPLIPAQPPCCQGNCTVGGSVLWVKNPLCLSLIGALQLCLCKNSNCKKRPLDPTLCLSVWL